VEKDWTKDWTKELKLQEKGNGTRTICVEEDVDDIWNEMS